MEPKYVKLKISKQKKIALIAHDGKKDEMIRWCNEHKDILEQHILCGTGTTARLITQLAGLTVKGYNSGPLGGDQQIGAKIVESSIFSFTNLRPSFSSISFTISRFRFGVLSFVKEFSSGYK